MSTTKSPAATQDRLAHDYGVVQLKSGRDSRVSPAVREHPDFKAAVKGVEETYKRFSRALGALDPAVLDFKSEATVAIQAFFDIEKRLAEELTLRQQALLQLAPLQEKLARIAVENLSPRQKVWARMDPTLLQSAQSAKNKVTDVAGKIKTMPVADLEKAVAAAEAAVEEALQILAALKAANGPSAAYLFSGECIAALGMPAFDKLGRMEGIILLNAEALTAAGLEKNAAHIAIARKIHDSKYRAHDVIEMLAGAKVTWDVDHDVIAGGENGIAALKERAGLDDTETHDLVWRLMEKGDRQAYAAAKNPKPPAPPEDTAQSTAHEPGPVAIQTIVPQVKPHERWFPTMDGQGHVLTLEEIVTGGLRFRLDANPNVAQGGFPFLWTFGANGNVKDGLSLVTHAGMKREDMVRKQYPEPIIAEIVTRLQGGEPLNVKELQRHFGNKQSEAREDHGSYSRVPRNRRTPKNRGNVEGTGD